MRLHPPHRVDIYLYYRDVAEEETILVMSQSFRRSYNYGVANVKSPEIVRPPEAFVLITR